MFMLMAVSIGALALMACGLAVLASVAIWFFQKREIWAETYGQGPFSRWLIEWGSFAGFLFFEMIVMGVCLIGGGFAARYFIR